MYPAHLATLNLAAREISDEANYPRVFRRDFFDFIPGKPFCYIPDNGSAQRAVALPPLDAVVGNPPYVRQEKIEKKHKERYGQMVSDAWPDLKLSGRSDLHCYFWPAATRLLKPDGYFGFLTSSSWLDVEYGFALQGWILRHFRILAIMESAAEPWFEHARIKTCITILQRCEDESKRMRNPVRFVRFNRKLADIIGIPPAQDEKARQASVDRLRKRIMQTESDYQDQDIRIIIKSQKDLWDAGVRAAALLTGSEEAEPPLDSEEGQIPDDEGAHPSSGLRKPLEFRGPYRAGKWGRHLRAPDFYFEIMRRFGDKFVPLGEIADIRFGVKSGCDAFFMPRDITTKMLRDHLGDKSFRQHSGGAARKDVKAGRLKIIEAGDGSIHPIEDKYVAPELHSPMEVCRPIVQAKDLDRVVLLVGEPLNQLRNKARWVYRYLLYGSRQTFASGKSKPVPVPKRSTCAARDPWYDLTGLVRPGIAFWPMAQKYRHIVPINPEDLICNHNLFDLSAPELNEKEQKILCAILNSTIVGLFKAFYGRFAGTETTLKTEVVDVGFIEIPDPRKASTSAARKVLAAFESIKKRQASHLLEDQLLDCHSSIRAAKIADGPIQFAKELKQPDRISLDDAVFELLGVDNADDRAALVADLHKSTAVYFRQGRVVELQAMENRAKTSQRNLNSEDLAADIWDALDLEDTTLLKEWLARQPEADSDITIPDERPAFLPENPLFELKVVSFGKDGKVSREYQSRAQAELVYRLAELGMSGGIRLPNDKESACKLLGRLNDRMNNFQARAKELVSSRTGDERRQTQIQELLEHWYIFGRVGSEESE